MTVSNTTTKITYVGDGKNRTFGIPFPILSAADLRVVITDSEGVETSADGQFTVNMAQKQLTYPTVGSRVPTLSKDCKITILRQTPLTQDIDLQSGHALDAEELERGFDKLTYVLQKLSEKMSRALTYKVSETNEHTAEEYLSKIAASLQAAAGAAQQAATAATQAKNAAQEVSSSVNEHNASQTAHNDLRNLIAKKQNVLTAGPGVDITDDIISITGAGGGNGGTGITVDSTLDSESTNPVQNKVIKAALDGKQKTLIPGPNVSIAADGTINFTGDTGSGSSTGLTGLVVYNERGYSKAARTGNFRTNIGTREYKFITLELCNADGTVWCTPLHSAVGYGNRSGNFATVYYAISASEFEGNTILADDTYGIKITLWY